MEEYLDPNATSVLYRNNNVGASSHVENEDFYESFSPDDGPGELTKDRGQHNTFQTNAKQQSKSPNRHDDSFPEPPPPLNPSRPSRSQHRPLPQAQSKQKDLSNKPKNTTIGRSNVQVQPPSEAAASDSIKQTSQRRIMSVCAVALAIFMALAGISFTLQMLEYSKYEGSKKVPASCMDVLQSGQKKSGIYTIASTTVPELSQQVYCDLESGGGGWTLVATIHENNIRAKCSLGDKWSSEIPATAGDIGESSSWENNNVFGALAGITGGDNKNSAYFSLNATDVMVWHVPNSATIDTIQRQAFFKYYTRSGFLNRYGNNLRNLFAEHLHQHEESVPPELLASIFIGKILENQNNITSNIPNWYRYSYSSGTTVHYLSDSNLFNGYGNRVDISAVGADFRLIKDFKYGSNFSSPVGDYFVTNAAIHPFTTLAWIENSYRTVETFSIKVSSKFAASGSPETHQGVLSINNYIVKYRAYHQYFTSSSINSVCEVYFAIENKQVWGSGDTILTATWSKETTKENQVDFSPLKRTLVGYTLLSRNRAFDSGRISKSQVEAVLLSFVKKASAIHYKPLSSGISVPVTFINGSQSAVRSRVPLLWKNDVQPGFIHFRPVHSFKESVAFCPGVRVLTDKAAFSSCVGSKSAKTNLCGDFSEWEGMANNHSTNNFPSWTGRSEDDIKSSIFLFTRNTN